MIDAKVIVIEPGYTRVPNRVEEAVTAAVHVTQLKAVRALLRLTLWLSMPDDNDLAS